MKKRGKKTLMESATDLAESMRPVIESAVDTAVETAKDTMDTAMDKMGTAIDKAGDKAGTAMDKASPILADGRDITREKARRGRRRAAVKLVALKEADASDKVAAFRAAEPKSEKGGRLKKLVLFGGLVALGGVIFKRLRGAPSKSNWQSSYVPPPAPRQTPSQSSQSSQPSHKAPADSTAAAHPADDEGAASPDEALADRASEPHADTTPDDPAEVVELRAVEDDAASDESAAGGSRKKS